MNYQNHAAEIRAKFPNREFLFVDDIAEILARSPKAIRSMIDRGKMPQAKKRGGRIGLTVMEMAEFLSEGDESSYGRKKQPKTTRSFILNPRSSPLDFSKAIAVARIQAEFATALANALEAISLRGKIEPSVRDSKKAL